MYNVLIVEDQEMPRQLFEIFVKSSENFQLAGSVSDAASAAYFCKNNKVDLVLMDVITNGGNNGLNAAEEIKKTMPEIKVIIVTSMPEYSWIKRAKEIGVDSFWYKESSGEPIIALMDRTMAGENIYPDSTPEVTIGLSTNHDFTSREMEILRELTTGDSNAEIAERLNLSAKTVKNHVQNLLEKTGFHTRAELAVEAARTGIVIKNTEK
ncbi:MAG: response regulator transcription factor [Clostridia bacterium]|nr:response regulator transcription factor [Clostridia bacterium]MBQ6467680.1 response regulator transcription factor [Clostridia bacterium]MBR5772511.1 response regulator transcription factor [Clostridia bacterium]